MWIERAISGLLLIVAGIHLLPVIGVLSKERVTALYAIAVADANVEILMRHRSVLFGILGLLLAYAAFKPQLQPLAFVAGAISVLSFFVLAYSVGDYNVAIARVVTADWIAAGCLAMAIVLYVVRPV